MVIEIVDGSVANVQFFGSLDKAKQLALEIVKEYEYDIQSDSVLEWWSDSDFTCSVCVFDAVANTMVYEEK